MLKKNASFNCAMFAIVACVTGSLGTAPAVHAEVTGSIVPGSSAASPEKIPFRTMTEPSNLPYMASVAPPGGKLVFALKGATVKNGRMSLILRYSCCTSGAEVIRYYAQMLPQMHWVVSSASEKQLSASFKNYSLSACVYAPSRPGSANDIQLTYQMPVDE